MSHMTEQERRDEVAHFMKIVTAFRQYEAYAISANTRRRRDFYRLPKEDKEILDSLGWRKQLDMVDELIHENAKVLEGIVANPAIFMDQEELALAENNNHDVRDSHGMDHMHSHGDGAHSHSHSSHSHSHGSHETSRRQQVSATDMDKVRSTLKQIVRDWSEEGKAERDVTYKPMIDALLEHFPDQGTWPEKKVLIPGAGLARLGWELAFLGFETQCNEFSHFMLLPSYFILNETKDVNQHTIYPHIHTFSNAMSAKSMMRGISFPDVSPSSLPRSSRFSMVAGDFEELFGPKEDPEEDETEQWDAVLTCFFIDTAKNIVNYLRIIHRILTPGGIWINCGPLLWHFENSEDISIELSLEEVKELAAKIGFELKDQRTIDTSYVGDEGSMLSYVYKTAFWTATKFAK